MNKKQYDEAIESLIAFVKRVSSDKDATPAEVAALPEIAKLLVDITSSSAT